jgi:hypothetical protein
MINKKLLKQKMFIWHPPINCNLDYFGKNAIFSKMYGESKMPLKLGRELRKTPIDPFLFVKAYI